MMLIETCTLFATLPILSRLPETALAIQDPIQ